MSKRSSERVATYSPQQFKSFPGALNAFFSTECPQLGGQRTRHVLVQAIVEMIERFYPPSTHLRAGQTPWVTVDKDEKSSYGKRMSQTQLTSVVLDLVPAEEATERKDGKKLRAIKKEAVARVFTQAYEQGGCLTNVETALLLKMSPSTVSTYTREWELENETLLPRRGTIHDMGPTLTHKKEIIERLFLQGKSVEQVTAIPARTPQQSDREVGRAAETAGPKRGCSDRRDGVDSLAMTFLKPSLRARTITA
jgi:hypothetical protein